MPRRKIKTIEIYKMITICVIFTLLIFCKFHKVNGEWMSIPIKQEMWTIIGLIVTNLFMGAVQIKPSKGIEHLKGAVLIALMILISGSTYLQLTVGEEMWALVGSVIAFVFRNEVDFD